MIKGAAPARTASALFRYIEDLQGDRPWGSFLDAGTGTHSIGWVAALDTPRWVAVTGATGHAAQVRDAVAPVRRAQDRLIVANWADPTLLAGERFDTVLADYLLGAIEGFAPYFQAQLFKRLRPHVGGRLYLTGLEPYVHEEPATPAGRMVWEIGRFRDACLLLAGERAYREYPLGWVTAQLEAAGFRILASKRFPIRYKGRFVDGQVDMCAPRLARLEDRTLADAMTAHGEALRARGLALVEAEGGLRHGHDYVIAAVPA